jgi:hypothetical protein
VLSGTHVQPCVKVKRPVYPRIKHWYQYFLIAQNALCVTLRCCFNDDIPRLMLLAKYHENITISNWQVTSFIIVLVLVVSIWPTDFKSLLVEHVQIWRETFFIFRSLFSGCARWSQLWLLLSADEWPGGKVPGRGEETQGISVSRTNRILRGITSVFSHVCIQLIPQLLPWLKRVNHYILGLGLS